MPVRGFVRAGAFPDRQRGPSHGPARGPEGTPHMQAVRVRLIGALAGVAAAVTTAGLALGAGTAAHAAPNPSTPVESSGSAGSAGSSGGCVGLVVDPGNGTVDKTCHPFSDGLTGQQLLKESGHQLTFDKNGFICQIDGYPDSCKSDNTHFWGYFHRAPGAAAATWTFSQKGASVYTVHPGETEGWAYQNGGQRQPEAVPYASLRQTGPSASATAEHPAAADTASDGDDGGSPWLELVVVAVVVLGLAGGATVRMMRRRHG